MDKYIGRLLDNRYEILEVIGTGGMAVVYKARCHRLNRLVAIKILKDDYLEDEEFRRRFHSESQAVAMLSHPNIVSVYDVSTSITADYIVMELIDGITLKQYMEKKGVLNWKETLHFAIQIAKALEHAHSRGIVHRDIKPHNVMVLKNGSVKVTDFGIARVMSQSNTLTKEALGSVHYISPEQAKGGRVDSRSDIYSLGVVMYEMMSGRPPYDGESPVAVAIKHINGGAAMPSTLNPNIPGGLEQIIMHAMAMDPGERYPSATKMLADMDEFRKDPGILFDYNTPPLEEVIRIQKPPLILNEEPPKSTAERVERKQTEGSAQPRRHSGQGAASGEKKPVRRSAKSREEERRSNVATIAIIACSAVMVLAIIIFLVVLFSDGTGPAPEYIDVPNLIGRNYEEVKNDTELGVQIKLNDKVYNSEYPAGYIIDQNPTVGGQIARGSVIAVNISMGPEPEEPIYMPAIAGQELEAAKRALKNLGIDLQLIENYENNDEIEEGKVIRTEPAAEEVLTTKQEVTIFVSLGVEFKTGFMPDIIDYSKENAQKVLDSQNLSLDIVYEEIFDSTTEIGKVVKTNPVANEEISTGKTVTVYISKGPQMLEITKGVLGLPVESVKSILENEGFKCEILSRESTKKEGTVIELRMDDKIVKPGDEIDAGKTLTLVVSLGTNVSNEVTKDVTIDLRGMAINNQCDVRVSRDGDEVYHATVPQGTTTIVIKNQTGFGKVQYMIDIEGDGWSHTEVFS